MGMPVSEPNMPKQKETRKTIYSVSPYLSISITNQDVSVFQAHRNPCAGLFESSKVQGGKSSLKTKHKYNKHTKIAHGPATYY